MLSWLFSWCLAVFLAIQHYFSGVDEAHIQDLLQAINTLSNLCEVSGINFLTRVLESWKHLYALVSESLCSKHGINPRESTGTVDGSGISKVKRKSCLVP